MRRRTPLRPSRGTTWPAAVRLAIGLRDHGCVGARLGFPGDCSGGLELDHVRAGGMGMKSDSVVENGVSLCAFHHLYKTMNGRLARPLLLDYLAAEPGATIDWTAAYDDRDGGHGER